MDVSVITVTWNSAEYIAQQIGSVSLACAGISCEQIIVDNDSADGTVELVKIQFPKVRLIENKENKGFAVANNQAVRLAKGEFILFLNPDMKLTSGSLDLLVKWLGERRRVGVVSCKLTDKSGELNQNALPRAFPGLLDQIFLLLKIPHIFPRVLGDYLYQDRDWNSEQEVDSVRGAFMLVRREVVEKLGRAFDGRYFLWFEEVDFCRTVKKLGYKVMYTPIVSCIDYVGQSLAKRNLLWRQKQFTKSMLEYFKKWEPRHVWVWLWLFRPLGIFLAGLNDLACRGRVQATPLKRAATD